MIKKIASISAIALSGVLMSGTVIAHEGGYVMDSAGKGVKDSYGNCIKSPTGNKVDGCGPKKEEKKEVAKPKPKPKPAPAPVKAPEPAPEPVVESKVETTSLSGGTHFAFDSARLNKSGTVALDQLVDSLGGMTIDAIHVVGHTDSKGSKAYNQRLSQRRAGAVASYLVKKGVNKSMITAEGRGESQPIASNKTREGRAQNRRVEITVTGSTITVAQ